MRSRRLIVQALYALMGEKRYDQITVQDIIDRADVGRSTFYAHFLDKEDLLVGEFQRVLAELEAQEPNAHAAHTGSKRTAASGGDLLPSLPLFRHVHDHQALYAALVRGHAVELIYRTAHRYLRESVERRLGTNTSTGGDSIPALRAASVTRCVPVTVLAEYLAGTFLTLTRWWLENGLLYSPEEMHAMFLQLAGPTVDAALAGGEGAAGAPLASGAGLSD
jgi:AcrR family transcriptional regulator